MANICEQSVAIAAKKDDLKPVLIKMAGNFAAISKKKGFAEDDLKELSVDEIAEKLQVANDEYWNHLCFFSSEPDTRSESGNFAVWDYKNASVIVIDMGLKWGMSEQPEGFCHELDKKKYGWAVVASGEAFEYEFVYFNGDYLDNKDAIKMQETAEKANFDRMKDLNKMAQHQLMANVWIDDFEDEDWDEDC